VSFARFKVPPSRATLQDAHDWLRQHVRDGAVCPCCRQLAKIYRRKLNSSMARSLIWLVRAAGPTLDWVEVTQRAPRWLVRSRELSKLTYWGLVEKCPKDPASTSGGRDSGAWRPTPDGVDFAMARTHLPAHALVYDNRVLRLDGAEQVDIRQALGKRFNYEELMRA
jgi:hypothetical protein